VPPTTDGWSISTVPKIDGRTALITGGASGLGARISKALSALGAQVTIADVDVKGATSVAEDIRTTVDNARPEVLGIDLGDLRSVERAATTFRSRHESLDLLVNNAGIMTPPYSRTAQGYESQWGINHLGHFALTAALLDLLMEQRGSRVVVQTSCVHRGGRINFEDIDSERSYGPWKAYKQSKLATLLFARELQRRLDRQEILSPICVACHPGLVDTPLYRNTRLMRWYLRPFMHSIEAGIQPALRACLDRSVKGGDIIGPDGWMEFKGRPVRVHPHRKGKDMHLAGMVWELSERMTGIEFSALIDATPRRNYSGRGAEGTAMLDNESER